VASPLREPPYVKFPKTLFDALLLSRMPPVHKAVSFAVVRRTIGHYKDKRPRDASPLSVQLLSRMTGHHPTRVSKARQDLIREGVLIQVSEHTFLRSAVLYINPDPSQWCAYSPDPAALCWEAAECGYAANRYEPGSKPLGGGQQAATEEAAHCGPLKNEDLLEEPTGRRRPTTSMGRPATALMILSPG